MLSQSKHSSLLISKIILASPKELLLLEGDIVRLIAHILKKTFLVRISTKETPKVRLLEITYSKMSEILNFDFEIHQSLIAFGM